jgi:hypothetical protein
MTKINVQEQTNMMEELLTQIRLTSEREEAAPHLLEELLWKTLVVFQGDSFLTAKKLAYTYSIRGNEMFVDRKEKSITRATVNMAFWKAMELDGVVTGPKKLGTFGASYLYPVFVKIGIIRLPEGQ